MNEEQARYAALLTDAFLLLAQGHEGQMAGVLQQLLQEITGPNPQKDQS